MEQRIGFAQQLKRNLLNINMKINWYFKPSTLYALAPVYFIVGEISFIHHSWMTSYNLRCHILHTHNKNRLHVHPTDCNFFSLLSFFKWIQRRQKINVIKVYLFTFILDTGLNSHALTIIWVSRTNHICMCIKASDPFCCC